MREKKGVRARLYNEYYTYIDSAKVASGSMPNREYHPAPEDLEIEVDSLLASLVHLRIPINILVIDILLQSVSEEAGPGGPESII